MRGTVFEVRKSGSRVKVILSRARPQLVQRLFEQEIPEIIDGVIEVRSMSREPGYRSKVAVSSSDQRVDCVGACVGVRGNRIKNIVDELGGERIDIVRWDDNLEVLIPNSLQPAEVEQVILCKMLGRAIVLVREDQLSLAIGRRGQNVRLASKLSGWDIEIMTQEELAESIDRAVQGFNSLEGVEIEVAERLVEEGFLSYDDLSVIEPDALMAMGGLTEEQVEKIVEQAEAKAEEAEKAATEARLLKREAERQAVQQGKLDAAAEVAAAATEKAAAAESISSELAGDEAAGDGSLNSESDAESPTVDNETASTAEEPADVSDDVPILADGAVSAQESDAAGDGIVEDEAQVGKTAASSETES